MPRKPPIVPSAKQLQDEALRQSVRDNAAFWRHFMPHNMAGIPPEKVSAQAYCNIIDALSDMLADAVAVAPDSRASLIFTSDPPYTAEQLLAKLRAHFDPKGLE